MSKVEMTDWKKLQNGSDIRGVALAEEGGAQVNLTPQVATRLAVALVQWLRQNGTGTVRRVAVGMDSRLTGPVLKHAVLQGLVQCGIEAVDCGLATTPAMFMITIDGRLPADAGVMITASHLPANRNGLKFFTRQGGFGKQDIAELLRLASQLTEPLPGQPGGAITRRDYLREYAQTMVQAVRRGAAMGERPLQGMKIVVDAGNGAGGFFATQVLQPLGADTAGSQLLEPDGRFPGHIPNPEDREAMQSISGAVLAAHADLGIIFDTDVDRSAIVGPDGRFINRNALIALISSVVLEEHPGSTIVTDSITSTGLAEFIAGHGGHHHRFRRGYKNVINEALRLNAEGHDCWIAIETSGHAALRENHFLDDGAYLVGKLLARAAQLRKQGRPLASLIASLRQPAESKEIRFALPDDDFASRGQRVLDRLRDTAAVTPGWQLEKPNYEGVRVNCMRPDEQGWFLLRLSLHDPVLPLNIESDVTGGVQAIERRLLPLIRSLLPTE